MRFLDRIRDMVRKNQSQITMGGGAAAVVFVVYVVFNLIMWNTVSFGYGVFYAIAAFFLFFIVNRLLGYVTKKKEGVIEKKT